MTEQTEFAKVYDLREAAADALKDNLDSPAVGESARVALDAMFRDAAGYGFTEADVVRAMLGRAFATRRGCGCHSCRAASSPYA